jgi:hypothetical protein
MGPISHLHIQAQADQTFAVVTNHNVIIAKAATLKAAVLLQNSILLEHIKKYR